MNFRLLVALFSLTVILTVVYERVDAVVIRHDKSDVDAVRLGEEFAAVGRVIPDGGCTLITPSWAVTAAHVGRSMKAGTKVDFAGKEYTVKRVIVHPDGTGPPGRPPEVDLALVEFTTAVEGVEPVSIYTKNDELGKTLYIVGYGDFGNPKAALKRTDGKRRAVTNVVDDAGPRRVFMGFDEPPKGTEFEGVGGPGDSGGPALLRENKKLYLVGVSSGSMNGKPGQYGVIDVYTRVGSYTDWIKENMKPLSGKLLSVPDQFAQIEGLFDLRILLDE